jgi:Bax protein
MAGVANPAQDRKFGLFHAVVAAAILAHVALVAVTFGLTLPRPADPAIAPVLPSVATLPVTRAALPPLAPGGRIVGPSSAEQLQQTFEGLAFDLDEIRGRAATVPRLRVTALPDDLGKIADIDRRKNIFLRTALPLVLMASEEVAHDRMRIIEIRAKRVRGVALDPREQRWLAAMAARYEVVQNDFEGLLHHVDTVPASLALAQSIEESGWGTSRFAHEGRALYGQRTWSARIAGLVPVRRADSKTFRVRSFVSLLDSARAYLFNLNTHPAYVDLRAERARLRAAGRPLSGMHLAAFLTRYAETGDAYIVHIRRLIRGNRLAALDDARLAPQLGVQIATRTTDR